VELAWPVEDPALRQRVFDECLQTYLDDRVDAWTMDGDGQYSLLQPTKPAGVRSRKALGAQGKLMALHGART